MKCTIWCKMLLFCLSVLHTLFTFFFFLILDDGRKGIKSVNINISVLSCQIWVLVDKYLHS